MSIKHQWECDECGKTVLFRQPELPEEDYNSECNEERICPRCGEQMFFDEVPEPRTAKKAT